MATDLAKTPFRVNLRALKTTESGLRMALFPSLSDKAQLSDVFQRFPHNSGALLVWIDGVLRAEGEFTIGERELIAAYVSGLNACSYCLETHRAYAEIFGQPKGLVEALLNDIDKAEIPDRMKPVLHYVRKLNQLPAGLTQADAQAVFDAGWSEDALFEAVQVAAAFNMMNRIVEGTGVNLDMASPDHDAQLPRHRGQHSYLALGRRLGLIPPADDSLNV